MPPAVKACTDKKGEIPVVIDNAFNAKPRIKEALAATRIHTSDLLQILLVHQPANRLFGVLNGALKNLNSPISLQFDFIQK